METKSQNFISNNFAISKPCSKMVQPIIPGSMWVKIVKYEGIKSRDRVYFMCFGCPCL